MCGTPNDLTRHHVIPQSLGEFALIPRTRTFVPRSAIRDRRNIVLLCRRHHDAIDTHRILRGLLRSLLTEQEELYIARTAGKHWLDRTYPRTEETNGQGN